jgi:diadenosine tetraphosphate (Ap4A) HIT family hydrolase
MDFTILDSKYWKAKLIEDQYYLGRSIVVFKGDIEFIHQLSDEQFLDLKQVINKLEIGLIKSFGTSNFNWGCLMNDSYKPENRAKKKELHLHLRPRYENSVDFAGELFVDEEFGHHYDRVKKKIVSEDILNQIADKIRTNL